MSIRIVLHCDQPAGPYGMCVGEVSVYDVDTVADAYAVAEPYGWRRSKTGLSCPRHRRGWLPEPWFLSGKPAAPVAALVRARR